MFRRQWWLWPRLGLHGISGKYLQVLGWVYTLHGLWPNISFLWHCGEDISVRCAEQTTACQSLDMLGAHLGSGGRMTIVVPGRQDWDPQSFPTIVQIFMKYLWRQCRPGNLCTHGQVMSSPDQMNHPNLANGILEFKVCHGTCYMHQMNQPNLPKIWHQLKFENYLREHVTRIMTASLQASISALRTARTGFPIWWSVLEPFFIIFLSLDWNPSLIKIFPDDYLWANIFPDTYLFQNLVPYARFPQQHWEPGDQISSSWPNILIIIMTKTGSYESDQLRACREIFELSKCDNNSLNVWQ